ncbi:hypothetical protein [Streptomyces sp. MMS20-AI2-20]|nr:hypothetical protein [Streptomyces sp. MMS20-AI2-20]
MVLPTALGPLPESVPRTISELALQRGLPHPLGQLVRQAALPR